MRIKNQRYIKNFKKTLLNYLKNDNLPIKKIKEIRLLKLKKLLIFAKTYSRFYKDLFSQKKLNPENSKSEEEIEILPILSKYEIKAFYKVTITIDATNELKNLHSYKWD
jgi:phenylacetate-coenzyme A ligase PaaK-like adenylate-forming protein